MKHIQVNTLHFRRMFDYYLSQFKYFILPFPKDAIITLITNFITEYPKGAVYFLIFIKYLLYS